ncbi:MAG: amino acid permease [Bacteroidia bacterium]|nr:amino acid permease [Bacteroidia bacterium]
MSIVPKLRVYDLSMIVINLVIGVGIFRSPQVVAEKALIPEVFFIAWIAGGLVSFCGALTFAEIGARFPAAGGFYGLFSHCYHPAFAFMMNWVLVINNAAACAGVAIMGAEYISPVILPQSLHNQQGITLIVLIVTGLLYGTNILGIRSGANTQNFLSVIKIGMMLVFCLAVFLPSGSGNAAVVSAVVPEYSLMDLVKALGISLIAIFFSYGGYQQTINFGSDVENPGRNIPKAIFIGIVLIVFLYLTLNYAYFHVLGFEGIRQSKLLASEIGKAMFGEYGYKITSVLLFVSVIGFLNATIMSNPRMYYAMAEDKVLPAIFKKVNEKTQVQEFALTFFILLVLAAYFFAGTFENILNYVMFIDTISLAAAASALFILRHKMKGESYSGYQIRVYPLIPVIFILMILICTVSVVYSEPQKALIATGLFLLGYPFYKIMTWK